MQKVSSIILAAGDGTRMKSNHSKVLCEVLFKPMLSWVLDSAKAAGIEKIAVVVSDKSDDVQKIIPKDCDIAVQGERLGTGHAVKMAQDFINKNIDTDILVLYGDAPFVDEETILLSHKAHKDSDNAVTVVSAHIENPTGYGRIYRENDKFSAIIEHSDANEEVRKITEINSGIYWFKAEFLNKALSLIKNDNSKGEYYLTDTIKLAKEMGKTVDAYMAKDSQIVLGANDRKSLSELNRMARDRVLDRLMSEGVEIPLTDGIVISNEASIGRDTVIMPNVVIKGKTTIGCGCVIGSGSVLYNTIIGDRVELLAVYADDSRVDSGAKIGPFVRLRPNTHIKAKAKIGNFVEVKNSVLGERTSVAHLTYIGDSDVGDDVNFGCGVVTANYDGAKKHRTIVGNSVFLGCNTNLVPPIKIGDGAITAAGTTITEDVPEGALAIGRAKQENKLDWAKEKGKYRK